MKQSGTFDAFKGVKVHIKKATKEVSEDKLQLNNKKGKGFIKNLLLPYHLITYALFSFKKYR